MKAQEFEYLLTDWSARNSGYDEHRNYIGLSYIADCQKEICRRYYEETPVLISQRLQTKATYEIEENIKNRLRAMGIYTEGKEIVLLDGLVKGHTDGEIQGDLLEIGTVPLSEHLPQERIPRRKYWQSQAYMKYGGYKRTLFVFYAREDGKLLVRESWPDKKIMDAIEAKISKIAEAVRNKILLPCECGRCQLSMQRKEER